MAQILVAILFGASAVPAILVINEIGFAWANLQAWVRLGQTVAEDPNAIPPQLTLSLIWAVIAPPIAAVLAVKGISRVVADARDIRQTEAIKARKKKRREAGRERRALREARKQSTVHQKPRKTTTPSRPAPQEAETESGESVEPVIEAEPDTQDEGAEGGFVPLIEDASQIERATDNQIQQPEQRHKAGTSLGTGILKKATDAAREKTVKPGRKKQPKSTPVETNKARPVRTSELMERAREIARDTREMVQDVINPEGEDDEESLETHPRRKSRIEPDKGGLFGRFLRRKNTSNEDVYPWGDAQIQESREQEEKADEVARAEETKQKITDILAFYAMWTSAGQDGRTQKMRQQAKRLAAGVDEDLSNAIVQEHGMRGFSALNTLRAAAGVNTNSRGKKETGPAEPMPKPSDDELREDGVGLADDAPEDKGEATDEDDQDWEDPRAFPDAASEDDEAQESENIPSGFELDSAEIDDDADDRDGASAAESYVAEDGYEATANDVETGVVADNLMLDDDAEADTSKARESAISSAARAMTQGDEGPKTGSENEIEDDTDTMPEEAYQESETDATKPAAPERENDPFGDEETDEDPEDMSGPLEIIDDVSQADGRAYDPDDSDEDEAPSRAPSWLEGGRPETATREEAAPAPKDTTDHTAVSDQAGNHRPQDEKLDAFALALQAQLEEIVDYQAKAYAWEQLGEEPPEKLDTEEKRKTYLSQLATSIVTLRDKMQAEPMDALRKTLEPEQIKWLDERADKVMATLMRGGTTTDVHDEMSAERGGAQPEWIEFRYNEFWSKITPFTKGYRRLAQTSEMKFFKSVQVNPMAQDEEAEDYYDEIEVLVADPRKGDESSGFKPGIMGIAFAIVPPGEWRVEQTSDDSTYPDRWALVRTDAREGASKVRLRDRSVEIFKEWARKRGRRPFGVVHIVLMEGASIGGEADVNAAAKVIAESLGGSVDVRVTGDVFDDATWSQVIVKEMMGA